LSWALIQGEADRAGGWGLAARYKMFRQRIKAKGGCDTPAGVSHPAPDSSSGGAGHSYCPVLEGLVLVLAAEELAANFSTRKVAGASVGWIDEVIGMNVDVGVAILHRLDQGAKRFSSQRAD
jgi:hypothetical protein